MDLTFPASQPPLGLVALHASLKAALSPMTVSAGTAPTLSLRTGTTSATTLTGDTSTIMRYLSRAASTGQAAAQPLSNCAVYPELKKPQLCAEIDAWLVHVQQSKSVQQLLAAIDQHNASTAFLVGPEPTLADYACWSSVAADSGATNTGSAAFNQWMQRMEALPECAHARSVLAPFTVTSGGNNDGSATTTAVTLDKSTLEDPRYPSNVIIAFRRCIANEIARVTDFKDTAAIETFIEFMKGSTADVADMCIAVPRMRLKGNPIKLAEEICSKIPPNEYIASVTCGGPFVNFFLRHETLKHLLLPKIATQSREYGTNLSGKGKQVIVEFSSPNIAKPFHAGHLRSTILGNFVRNVCKSNGMTTTAINYLGDWGKQYGLLAVGYEMYGSEELLVNDPIQHLFEVYVKVNEDAKERPEIHDQARAYFKRMEDGDKDALGLWSRFRALSIERYKQIYARLNVEFDVYSGESEYSEGMRRVMSHLTDKKLLQESKGALIVDLQPFKMVPAVVQKGDGATLYITRDIAAAWERQETYKFDKMFYTVGAQQDLHFQQLFKILELAGFEWSKQCTHINFGMVRGMSTRKGTVVFLEEILDEAYQVMHGVMQNNPEKYAQIAEPEKIADIIGISAVIIQDMGAKRLKDYTFDWARMTSFEGDTGPYLQYSHARLCSIERKYLASLPGADPAAVTNPPVPPFAYDPALERHMSHPKFDSLCLSLAQFPDLIASIPERNFEACHVVTYLMDLCHKVSTAIEELYVSGQEPDIARARFWVYWSAKTTLANGMRLLGLRPVERM